MFQIKTSGEVRVGARDGYYGIVFPHMRLFPHNNSEIPSYSMPSTIKYRIADGSRVKLTQATNPSSYAGQCHLSLHCTALPCTALHYTALPCTVLYCPALYCTALHCTVLHCTVLQFTAVYCTALYLSFMLCTALHCTALHCTVLQFTAVYCTALQYNAVNWTVLHFSLHYCTLLNIVWFTVQYFTSILTACLHQKWFEITRIFAQPSHQLAEFTLCWASY